LNGLSVGIGGRDGDPRTVPRPLPVDDHQCAEVEELRDGYVLRCTCGWRSEPATRAAEVGAQWDDHLAW
jgi:hypothetical protein